MNYYIACDIGGTRIRVACYPSESLTPVKIVRISTRDQDNPNFGTTPLERLTNLIAHIHPTDGHLLAISVAVPGPVNPYTGIIIEAPNIPGWVNLPIRQHLEDRFEKPVVVGNDANLAGLGEWMFGAGKGHHHMIYITISTGIGSGFIVDDQLLYGASGLAGELGHITILPDGPLCSCGLRGHLEAIASGPAIENWVNNEISQGTPSALPTKQPVTTKMIAEAARKGDRLAIQGLARAGTYLGQALGSILHLFNPSAILFGGGVSQSGDLLFTPMQAALQENVFNPNYLHNLKITNATFGDDAGLVGALAHGRMKFPDPFNPQLS